MPLPLVIRHSSSNLGLKKPSAFGPGFAILVLFSAPFCGQKSVFIRVHPWLKIDSPWWGERPREPVTCEKFFNSR